MHTLRFCDQHIIAVARCFLFMFVWFKFSKKFGDTDASLQAVQSFLKYSLLIAIFGPATSPPTEVLVERQEKIAEAYQSFEAVSIAHRLFI